MLLLQKMEKALLAYRMSQF